MLVNQIIILFHMLDCKIAFELMQDVHAEVYTNFLFVSSSSGNTSIFLTEVMKMFFWWKHSLGGNRPMVL